jgi:hypothetical protein
MALTEKGDHRYGDSRADIRSEIERYSALNAYPALQFADATCGCGGTRFALKLDDTEGAAVRTCAACGSEHAMGDSDEYLDQAELEECACPCGAEAFEIAVGLALYDDSDDVRWLYLGCRCTQCGLTAVYGDWKNEYEGYQKLLSNV